MKVWVLRIVAAIALITIGLLCHKKMQAVKNQLLTYSPNKKDVKLEPVDIIKGSDETSLDWGEGGGISDSDRDGSKNLKRDLKREKLAPLFSQRISMLKEACSQMNDTNRVDQKPRKWSVNPQHKLLYSHGRSGGSQLASRRWEKKFVSDREKQEIIDSLGDPNHEYISFFVCRNPVAKLVSIYNYHKALSSSSYNGPHGPHKDILGFPLDDPPSWDDYLKFDPYRTGLTRPMWIMCDPCHNYWDAVVLMETFDRDSAAILKAIGSKVKVDHLNEHSNAAASGVPASLVWKLFRNSTAETLSGILDAYSRDFLMCGYTDTLKDLKRVLASKEENQQT